MTRGDGGRHQSTKLDLGHRRAGTSRRLLLRGSGGRKSPAHSTLEGSAAWAASRFESGREAKASGFESSAFRHRRRFRAVVDTLCQGG